MLLKGFQLRAAILGFILITLETISSVKGDQCLKLNSELQDQLTDIKGKVIVYTLDNTGTFHRLIPAQTFKSGTITYSVLKNGILVPSGGPYPITYYISGRGDLIPDPTSPCIYKSDKAAFYLRGKNKILIPVEIYHSGEKINYIFEGNVLHSEPMVKTNHSLSLTNCMVQNQSILVPDKMCNGDITLFLLGHNGKFLRNPPDEFLPNGMRLKYQLRDDGALVPKISPKPGQLHLTYLTGKNGCLTPCSSNSHTLTTSVEATKSYILAEGGILAPVSEVVGSNMTVSYFYNGKLIHRTNQFKQAFSNSSIVYLSEKNKDISDTEVQNIGTGPKFECSRHQISRRAVKPIESRELEEADPKKSGKSESAFVYDNTGKKISLEPYLDENEKVAIFKLTCKGYLKRMNPYQEPECGFEVKFQVHDSFIMTPITKKTEGVYLRYILQSDGNLKPIKNQKFTLKKAPASMVYYILGKQKELLPVRMKILPNNQVEVYYQDVCIYTIPSEKGKDVEVFTTLYAPLYAYCNNRLTLIHSDAPPNEEKGATWTNCEKTEVSYPIKNLYLVGPDKVKTKVEMELNQNNVPVIYEMDWNGVCHRSPKEDNKNMVLKSYKLLPEGILLPTNDSNGYIYLVDRQGNMLPYCYPDSKIRAPHGLTVKYVRCKKGILLPVLVEALKNHIRFSFENTVIYFKKAYKLEEILEKVSWDEKPHSNNKEENDIYQKENGDFVCFEKVGKILNRNPQKQMSASIVGHVGCMTITDNGGRMDPVDSLEEPGQNIELEVEKKGNLLIRANPSKVKLGKFWLLAKNASLIAVCCEKKDGLLQISRNGEKIATIKADKWNLIEDLKDPLGLYKDPAPLNSTSDSPHHIHIPIEPERPKTEPLTFDSKKCEQIRKTVKELVDKDPSMQGIPLEMSDSMMDEIYKMVCKCSKTDCGETKRAKRQILRMRREPVLSSEHDC